MKKCLSLLLLSSLVLFASCNKNTKEDSAITVSGVTLDQTSLNLAVNDKATLVATVTPQDADDKSVTWSSSDPKIATVSESGEVVAIGRGDAVITATSVADKSKTATCNVQVSGTLSFLISNVKDAPAVTVVNSIKVENKNRETNVVTTYATGTWNGSEGTMTFSEDKVPELVTLSEAFNNGDMSKVTITDPNVKISMAIPGIQGYLTGQDKNVGIFLFLNEGQQVQPAFFYVADKLELKGTIIMNTSPIEIDLKLNKGWNMFYLYFPTKTQPGIYSTEAPVNPQWLYMEVK